MYPKARMKDRDKGQNIESQAQMVLGRNDPGPCQIIHKNVRLITHERIHPVHLQFKKKRFIVWSTVLLYLLTAAVQVSDRVFFWDNEKKKGACFLFWGISKIHTENALGKNLNVRD